METVTTVISLCCCMEPLVAMQKSTAVWSHGCSSNASGCASSFYPGDDNIIVRRNDPSFSSAENVLIVVRCQGIDGVTNEVLYLAPPSRENHKVLGNVIFWPGDVQDLHHRM